MKVLDMVNNNLIIEQLNEVIQNLNLPKDIESDVLNGLINEIEETGTFSMDSISKLQSIAEEKSVIPLALNNKEQLKMKEIKQLSKSEAEKLFNRLQQLYHLQMELLIAENKVLKENNEILDNNQKYYYYKQQLSQLKRYKQSKIDVKVSLDFQLKDQESRFFKNKTLIASLKEKINNINKQIKHIDENIKRLEVNKLEFKPTKSINENWIKAKLVQRLK